VSLSKEELDAWLRLAHRVGVGVGRASMRRLLAALGSPQAVASAPLETLQEVVGKRAEELLAEPPGHVARVAATLAWLDGRPNRRVLTLADSDYPALLLQTADPPLLLYLEGRVELLDADSVAIVGSRRPTPQGLENARRLARELGGRGWAVVSGLAAGIDGAAHAGALEAPAGTVAVVGTGLDMVYPHAHRALAARIAREGLMVSEFPLGMAPMPDNFPQRNRIIAGLSRGTLVVEAALRSGSLITARQATEAGREVFAVPGSIQSPQARGCHALLRDGAKLVETVDDILEELGGAAARPVRGGRLDGDAAQPPEPAAPDDEDADEVLRALGHDPVSLDALIARCGWAAPQLNVRLMELELEGRVARLPGGLFQRQQLV
jgi:DNA processing protein